MIFNCLVLCILSSRLDKICRTNIGLTAEDRYPWREWNFTLLQFKLTFFFYFQQLLNRRLKRQIKIAWINWKSLHSKFRSFFKSYIRPVSFHLINVIHILKPTLFWKTRIKCILKISALRIRIFLSGYLYMFVYYAYTYIYKKLQYKCKLSGNK